MKDLLIFGTGKIADVVYYYAKEECGYNVAAFVVDEKFKTADVSNGLPVVSFENMEKTYPPDRYDAFVAVGYHDLNELREAKFAAMISKGYNLVSVVSPKSNVPKNVKIGKNCFIMSPAIIHPCVEIGDDVFIWSGAMVGHHSKIQDHCWLTSCCNISGNVTIGKNTFVAVNATVGHSVTIGDRCFLGANTLVIKNLEPERVVIAESAQPMKLSSKQFLKFSSFSSL